MAMFHSLWTVLLVIVFLVIVGLAWSGRRKKEFASAARIPLEDDGEPNTDSKQRELKDG